MTTLWDLAGTEMVSGSMDQILSTRPGYNRLPSVRAFDKVKEEGKEERVHVRGREEERVCGKVIGGWDNHTCTCM